MSWWALLRSLYRQFPDCSPTPRPSINPSPSILALLGLATLLFTPFSRSRSSGAQKLAIALLVIAVVAQTFILLAPLEQIGGLPPNCCRWG